MSASNKSSGYKQQNPPIDDCCPICFGSFTLPCQTSCGHWFCARCILEYRRHSANNSIWCKCPMCGSDVKKLVPHSSVLIGPTEEKRKVLDEVKSYGPNAEAGVSVPRLLWTLFLRAHTVPSWTELRRYYRAEIEHGRADPKLPEPLKRVMRVVFFLVLSLYLFCGFHIPFGVIWIIPAMEIPICALDLFLMLDASWHYWKDKRRQRRLEAVVAAQHED